VIFTPVVGVLLVLASDPAPPRPAPLLPPDHCACCRDR
jgi:hypothetical protein